MEGKENKAEKPTMMTWLDGTKHLIRINKIRSVHTFNSIDDHGEDDFCIKISDDFQSEIILKFKDESVRDKQLEILTYKLQDFGVVIV